MNYDVWLLQETHSKETDSNRWLNEWGGVGVFSHGDPRSRGVAILVRPGAPVKFGDVHNDDDGRYLIAQVNYNGVSLLIGNVYGPNDDHPAIYESFCAKINETDHDLVILGGDYNFCLDVAKDREVRVGGSARNNLGCKRVIDQFMEEHNIVDVWRTQHPDTKKIHASLK